MRAWHAMETTHKTYTVSYGKRYLQSEDVDGVSELDAEGRVVRTFNNPHIDAASVKFNWPRYLAIDGQNHVIVADSRNKRVVVLTSSWQLKPVLIQTDGEPWRLCLSKSTGLMFVNNYNSYNIDIYQVKTLMDSTASVEDKFIECTKL